MVFSFEFPLKKCTFTDAVVIQMMCRTSDFFVGLLKIKLSLRWHATPRSREFLSFIFDLVYKPS